MFANGGLLKLGPYLPWKLEGSKLPLMVIYNQMIYIKEMTPRSPRKTSLGCETIKWLWEDLHHKGAENDLQLQVS